MKRFSAPGRLSAPLSLVSSLGLLLGLAGPASAQRELEAPADLKPIPSGPGIQVCEPVATGNDALADFGGGCGLWLQWAMGFHPQLGQTPRWELASRAHRELHVPHLRLSLAQGSKLYNILGVTHIAVGQITGTTAKCLLTYQLYAVPTQKAVGVPIKLAGTEEQVLAQLPGAARTLLTVLEVQKLHVPAGVGATPADLTTVGHYTWYSDQKPTEAEQQQIDVLGRKLPLAALLSYMHRTDASTKEKELAAQSVIEQTGGNFLMLGAVATTITKPSEEFGHRMDSLFAAVAPNNAVLAYWAIARAHTREEAIKATERIARLAPHSSTAWNILAKQYADQGESIRLARIYAGLSPPEAEKLAAIYARWYYAATRATALDADYQDAWKELAKAATFAGASDRADAAFWKAMSLDKNDLSLYTWGLEMYQPKWGGDPATLAKVARLSTTAEFPANADLHNLGSELQSAGFPVDAKAMFARAMVQAREAVRQYPNNARPHATLGYYLNDQGQAAEAETELKTALRLDPDSDVGHFQLGKLYAKQRRYAEAATQFKEDYRITRNPGVKAAQAEAMSYAGQMDEAEKMLYEVLKEQPNLFDAHWALGSILARKKEVDAAIAVYKDAERLKPDASGPHRELGRLYQSQGKYDEAVQEGELSVRFGPRDFSSLFYLGQTYALKSDDTASVKMYQRAIELFPDYALTHLELGKLFLKMGRKEEGRAELKRVLELNGPADEKKSAQELRDKNP
jgi:tetratricopeptide (TPR) repeat protein